MLSEIGKIKEKQKAAAGEGSSGKTGSSKKRRPVDDTDGRRGAMFVGAQADGERRTRTR